MREERLREGMENTQNDNTLELTGNENKFRCMLCNRTSVRTEVNTTLENMQKKAIR